MLKQGREVGGLRMKRRQGGFTLIEMIVVVAILVILAGFILPKLDRVMLKSNKGVAAANMGGVSRYIQTYRIVHNVYPDVWDSLVNEGTTVASHTLVAPGIPGTTPGIDPQLTGGPPGGSPKKLTTLDLSPTGSFTATERLKAARSLSRMGITRILDWTASSGELPGNRFLSDRTNATTAGSLFNALGTDTAADAVVAIPNVADGDGAALIDHIYPENKLPGGVSGTIPTGKILVVFGFGPLNKAIGDVLQECPTYANTDATQYYNRNLAIFEVSLGGSRAELKAVVGGDADRIDEEVADYYEK